MRQYVYRPGDFRWVYDDPAWIDWYREDLHNLYAAWPVPALTTIRHDHGAGPSAIHVEQLMDQHVFRGSDGGKAIYPLWRPFASKAALPDPRTPIVLERQCTFTTRVYDWLESLGRGADVEDAYDYILAVLSAPTYSSTYWRALEVDPIRVPLTTEQGVFATGAVMGKQLRAAWTLQSPKYAALSWAGKATNAPLGSAAMGNGGIVFDNGRGLAGVTDEVWDFQISGYFVVRRWFAARKHWTVSATQATATIAFVSSMQAFIDLSPDLNTLLAAATATS